MSESPRDKPGRAERLIKPAIVGVLGGLAVMATIANHHPQPTLVDAPAPLQAFASCPQPNQKSILAVERLFTQSPSKTKTEANKADLTFYWGAAANFGSSNYQVRPNDRIEPSYYINWASNITEHYGVKIAIGNTATKYPYGFHAPSKKDLESGELVRELNGIMNGFEEMPTQYAKATGLKEIDLVSGGKSQWYVDWDVNKIFWNVRNRTSYDPIDDRSADLGTAMGYLMQARMCGGSNGIEHDRGFRVMNQNVFPTLPTSAMRTKYYDMAKHPRQVIDMTTFDYRKARGSSVEILTQDSTQDMSAEKADLLSSVLTPYLATEAISPTHPLLRAKYIYTMAQLYETQPGVVTNLAMNADWTAGGQQKPLPAGLQPDRPYSLALINGT